MGDILFTKFLWFWALLWNYFSGFSFYQSSFLGLFEKLSFCFWTKFSKNIIDSLKKILIFEHTVVFLILTKFCFLICFFMHELQKLFFCYFLNVFWMLSRWQCELRSCFRKDKMKLKACSIHVLLVDKLKKKNKQQGRQRQGRDGVSVQMSMSR